MIYIMKWFAMISLVYNMYLKSSNQKFEQLSLFWNCCGHRAARPGRGAAVLVKWHATFKVRNSSKNWILDIFNEKTLRNVKFSVLMWFLLPVCVYTLLILLNWKCFTDILVSSSKALCFKDYSGNKWKENKVSFWSNQQVNSYTPSLVIVFEISIVKYFKRLYA